MEKIVIIGIFVICVIATSGITYYSVNAVKEQEISELNTLYEFNMNNLTEHISDLNDTDGDGYPDGVDLFPDDSEIHDIIEVYGAYSAMVGADRPLIVSPNSTDEVNWFVERDYKYIEITYEIANVTNNLTVFEGTPPFAVNISLIQHHGFSITTLYLDQSMWEERFNVTYMGRWRLIVSNPPENPQIGVHLWIRIYK